MDRINNNSNNYNKPFSGTNKDKPVMLDKEEKMKILTSKTKEVLSQAAEREVPENGRFSRVFVTFSVPESDNKAVFSIIHDDVDYKDKRQLSICVHRQNSDRMFSNFIMKGTKKEIIEFLNDERNNEELKQIVEHLSVKADDYYSDLL